MQSPFTDGIKVSITPEQFETVLSFLTTYYTPVSLDDVLIEGRGRGLPERPILVTFDDAYASVAKCAAGLCRRFKVPAIFFVNAAFVDNHRLAPDNLVCHVFNVFGMKMINTAAQAVSKNRYRELRSLTDVFRGLFPAISLAERDEFLLVLRELAGIDEEQLAANAQLYVTSKDLSDLRTFGFEIGNHTYSHAYCRTLSEDDFASEVDRNKAELEAVTGTRVRSFSLPYGSSKDLSKGLAERLEASGHQAVFLSESVANSRNANLFHLDRVSTCTADEKTLFFELEVLPRLRAQRNWVLQSLDRDEESRHQASIDSEGAVSLNEDIEAAKRRRGRA